jgi:hypothetical protein
VIVHDEVEGESSVGGSGEVQHATVHEEAEDEQGEERLSPSLGSSGAPREESPRRVEGSDHGERND